MKDLFRIDGKSDDELIAEYSIDVEGKTFVPAGLLDAIGERQVRMAERKPGDPGTIENPIFKDGKAYVFSRRNKLILWEDYSGPVPESKRQTVSKETEAFTLTAGMKPTEEQKKMIRKAQKMPVIITPDCPLIPPEKLSSFKRFRSSRPVL